MSTMTRRHRIVRIAGTALLAAAVLAAAAVPAAAGDSKKTPAKKYANGVCSALLDWGDALGSTLGDLSDADSLEAAAQQATDGIEQATKQLVKSIEALGTPSTDDGKKAKQSVTKLSNQLSDDADSIRHELEDPPDSPADIAALFAQIGVDVEKAVSQVKATATTLKGLDARGELRKAFESASSCKEIKSSL